MACVYGRSLAGIAGSNPTGCFLRRADDSFRGVLLSVGVLGVIEGLHRGGLDPLGLSNHKKNAINYSMAISLVNIEENSDVSDLIFPGPSF
jgi:hypothetical protein